jgi:hypothetical protein
MRMLIIYDSDEVHEVFSGFESYNDNLIKYFKDSLKNKMSDEIKRNILNLVKHAFFLKILL